MIKLQAEVDASTLQLLSRFGFDEAVFERLRRRLIEGRAEDADNRVCGRLDPPDTGDMVVLPPRGSREREALTSAGRATLARGEVCAVVLAGGMATRFGGMVKAGVEVLPGATFLDLKLRNFKQLAQGLQISLPVLLMTSFATDTEVTRLARAESGGALDVQTFPQLISLRLEPSGALLRDERGRASPYAPGHGDLVFALRRAGLLQTLHARGVRYLFMSNVDNLAATLDPAVIGAHVLAGVAITFEVCALAPGDKGGVPARLGGRLQVIEALRYPKDFVESTIPWFSINNITFTLSELDQDFPLDWFRVTKAVHHRPAIQFERLVNQLTAFLPAQALVVEREGADGRFLPIKDPEELVLRRPMIQALFGRRGTP